MLNASTTEKNNKRALKSVEQASDKAAALIAHETELEMRHLNKN